MGNIEAIFGSMVFSDKVMRSLLPHDTYEKLQKTIQEGRDLDRGVADVVANACLLYTSVAVDCDACGKKLIRVLCAFREEIDDLPSFNINNRYPLACRCGNTFSATGVYCVFTQCSHSFQCVQYGNTGYSLFALREEV